MKMQTRCPHCYTPYTIEEKTLEATDGLARCDYCHGIFNAYEAVRSGAAAEPVPKASAKSADAPVGQQRTVAGVERAPRAPRDTATATRPAAPARSIAPAAAPEPGAPPHDDVLEELIGEERGRGGRWRVVLVVLIVVLTGTIMAQWAWHERDSLVAQPELRPYLQAICQPIGCKLPALRNPELLEVIDRELSPSESYPGALSLLARLRNNASHSQPAPKLQLALFDNQHRLLARRRFQPSQYLPEEKADATLRPGEALQIELLIEDPGVQATGFELAFY